MAAHKDLPADDERQHAVGRGLLQLGIAAAGRKAEPRAVDELAVFFGKLAVLVLFDLGRGVGVDLAVRQALEQQVGALHGVQGRQLGQRGGLGRPERVVLRQGQHQQALHAPVRAAGGVVALAHIQLRVAVADGQHAVAVEDGLGQPPLEVAHDDAFHDRQRQRFQPGEDAGRIERALAEPVPQAAAVGQRGAVFVEPEGELAPKFQRALAEARRPRGRALGRKDAVQYAVVLQRPGDVVVALGFDGGVAVGVPAVADIPAVDLVKVALHPRQVAGHADRVQRQVDQHAEKQPVAVRQLMGVDGVQPAGKVLLFVFRQRLPDQLRHFQDGAADGRHLDKKLVVVAGVAPIFGALRVGAGGQAAAVERGERFRRAAAQPVGAQRPQRAGEPLHADGARRVAGAGVAQVQQRAARRVQRQQRVQQAAGQGLKVLPGVQLHSVHPLYPKLGIPFQRRRSRCAASLGRRSRVKMPLRLPPTRMGPWMVAKSAKFHSSSPTKKG